MQTLLVGQSSVGGKGSTMLVVAAFQPESVFMYAGNQGDDE